MKIDVKDYYKLKHDLNVMRIQDDQSLMKKVFEKLSLTRFFSEKPPKVPTFKFPSTYDHNIIDHGQSIHSLGI